MDLFLLRNRRIENEHQEDELKEHSEGKKLMIEEGNGEYDRGVSKRS